MFLITLFSEFQGETPLMHAATNGNLDMIRVLMEHGADPTIEDKDGRQAVDRFGDDVHEHPDLAAKHSEMKELLQVKKST